MFYTFIRYVAAGVVWLINGRYTLTGQDKLPQGNYILVGPHRTWWDPIFFALAAWPHKFSFMAKKELFKNPILRWFTPMLFPLIVKTLAHQPLRFQ